MDELSYENMIAMLHRRFEGLPDYRTGNNTQYRIADGALGAFGAFFTQCSSFLAYQRNLKRTKGNSNAESLFGIETIPSDNHIRNLLDPLEPSLVFPLFREIFRGLQSHGELAKMRSHQERLLLSFDGTQYFSSQQIHCSNCSERKLANEETLYHHQVITPVVVQPENSNVIALEPEFIVPQDGHKKQDCERTAIKRWLKEHGSFYAEHECTALGDDLYCCQPICEQFVATGFDFIFVCKPDSHEILYEWIEYLERTGEVEHLTFRRWNGRYAERWAYRFVNDVPIRGGEDALDVNWCEITITRKDNGRQLYHNSFATSHKITKTNVVAIVQDGRARWKSENENNNVLKTKGYHLEHNFGHGQQFLASFLLTLNLLAFLFHTVFGLLDERYQLIRKELGPRKTFFNDMRALLRYMIFEDWSHLLGFMMEGLELEFDTS
jgi:hypothetical protein